MKKSKFIIIIIILLIIIGTIICYLKGGYITPSVYESGEQCRGIRLIGFKDKKINDIICDYDGNDIYMSADNIAYKRKWGAFKKIESLNGVVKLTSENTTSYALFNNGSVQEYKNDICIPVDELSDFNCIDISSGDEFTAFLKDDNTVWIKGVDIYNTDSEKAFYQLECPTEITKIATFDDILYALGINGKVYVTNSGGIGSVVPIVNNIEMMYTIECDKPIIDMFVGKMCTFFIDIEDKIYFWGRNDSLFYAPYGYSDILEIGLEKMTNQMLSGGDEIITQSPMFIANDIISVAREVNNLCYVYFMSKNNELFLYTGSSINDEGVVNPELYLLRNYVKDYMLTKNGVIVVDNNDNYYLYIVDLYSMFYK